MTSLTYSPRFRPPKQIINSHSTSGQAVDPNGGTTWYGAQKLTCGALTANVLAQQINVSGAGEINFLRVHQVSAGSTIRVKLTLDGVVVFDSTSLAGGGSVPVIGAAYAAVGGGAYPAVLDKVQFNTSMLLEVASNVTESALINTYVTYKLY